ncbi:MAG: CinA family protein [Gammaproteobacteria bacterium]|nr:CinA family protein [Gammaproteobacteria bacterium]
MYGLAEVLGRALSARGYKLVTAESCTGGWLAQAMTAVPGSSGWFERGFVVYSNASKCELLGVRAETLARFGAVSIETAAEMAEGALRASHADVSIAITGIAGPAGGTAERPAGTICLAWRGGPQPPQARVFQIEGTREGVRRRAVVVALEGLIERLGTGA